MSEIASKVKAIIVDKLGVDESEVVNEASFTNDLGADSLDTVELIMEFEKEFDIQIPDDQAENIATVGSSDFLYREFIIFFYGFKESSCYWSWSSHPNWEQS